MPEVRSDQPLLPSVLDRLLDLDPDSKQEVPRSRHQQLADLKRSVCRDLEHLLNTRVRCVPYPPELKELERSLVSYGIPDMTGASLSSKSERQEFCEVVKETISLFETRLKKLKVQMIDPSGTLNRTIRFQIDAMLQAKPAPEPITFDSALHLSTGTFEVKGKGNE